jgi:predicted transposase YbfD/YdcC
MKKSVFGDFFEKVDDPRKNNWLCKYDLHEVLIISIAAVLGGCDDFFSIAVFAEAKEEWFREFLELKHGIPSHDTFNRIFNLINPEQFSHAFSLWVESIRVKIPYEIVSIDGKTMRGSRDLNTSPIHIVSAFASENEVILGQVATEKKSNEITAIPNLLEILDIHGCIVTIDAMGCQKSIAEKIISNQGDYVFSLKGNHGKLHNEIQEKFEGKSPKSLSSSLGKKYTEEDEGHGRIEKRSYWITESIDFLEQKDDWKGLKSVGVVERERTLKNVGKTVTERHYFLCSIEANPEILAQAVRKHWGIENKVHWCLDVVFNEDSSRAKNNAAENLSKLRHIALNIFRKDETKKSLRSKRNTAGWNNNYLAKLMNNYVL